MPAWAWTTAAPKAKTKASMVKPAKPLEQSILAEKSNILSATELASFPSADEQARRSRFQKAKDRK